MSATIRPVVRPRGVLTDEQRKELAIARARKDVWDENYRNTVVGVLRDGASFSEVSKATGLSTNTLQRWKREAGE